MYTLILTIALQWNDAEISAIPNFTSIEYCTTAGVQWVGLQMKGLGRLSYDISALCVKQ